MLSIIPAALFAGWRGLSMRSRISQGTGDAPPQTASVADEAAPMYSYSYVADPAEREFSYDAPTYTTVYFYDEDGRPLDHRVLPQHDRRAKHGASEA